MLTYLTGGARSGKSSLAVRMAEASELAVVFIATAEALDDEMTDRIVRHQAERPLAWATVEAPLALGEAVTAITPEAFVIIDCLSLWVSNQIFDRSVTGSHDAEVDRLIESRATELAVVLASRIGPTVVVTNEVGLGIVPDNVLARRYRDVLGRVNAIICAAAEPAFLCVSGRVMRLEVAPVDLS